MPPDFGGKWGTGVDCLNSRFPRSTLLCGIPREADFRFLYNVLSFKLIHIFTNQIIRRSKNNDRTEIEEVLL